MVSTIIEFKTGNNFRKGKQSADFRVKIKLFTKMMVQCTAERSGQKYSLFYLNPNLKIQTFKTFLK